MNSYPSWLCVLLPPEIYKKYQVGFGHEGIVSRPFWAEHEPELFRRMLRGHNLVCMYAEKFPRIGEKFRFRGTMGYMYYDLLNWAEEYFLGAIKYK